MSFQLLLHSPATLVLLVANIAISILAFGNSRLLDAMLLDVGAIRRRNQHYRLVTSGFVHGDPGHLFMNMLTLFFFGPYLEYRVGTEAFVLVYFLSLLAGSAWSYMENFRNPNYKALGASGAISGVVIAFALFEPFAMLFVFFIPAPAIVFAVLYIVYSAYASSGRRSDGIGHGAHLGGALMGLVTVCVFWPEAIRHLWRELARLIGV